MFSTIYEDRIGKKRFIVGFINSNDEKPTDDILNGSMLKEIDTKKTYLFDGKTSTWIAQ